MRRSVSRSSSEGPESPFAARKGSPAKRVCIMNPITQKLMILYPPRTKRPEPTPNMQDDALQPDFLSLQTLSFIPGGGPLPLDAFQSFPGLLPGVGNLNPLYSMDLNPTWTPSLFPNMGSQSSSNLEDEDEDEEDEGEKDLDVDHFLDFSEDSEDEATNDDAEEGETTTDGQKDKDGSAAGGDKPAFSILSHLGGMNVGAFRRHQTTTQLIARGEATPDSLSFANPLFNGTLRGIRDGALPAAATSLTPERRRKPQPAKSPLENSSLKRRASAMAEGAHKKHKSISDVRDFGKMQI